MNIDRERLVLLDSGQAECRHLSECLAVDFATIMAAVFHDVAPQKIEYMRAASGLGISQRMCVAAEILGPSALERAINHFSDTVRSWAAFIIGAEENMSLAERLDKIRPLADDHHFGVREWAGVALRKHIIDAPEEAIQLFSRWSHDPSPFIRRYGCEFTRPRGVWVTHFGLMKEHPERALPILKPLRADPERYVQDSVANWLNDASKSKPQWVESICSSWLESSDSSTTKYIIKRALRTLRKEKL